jgi:hypothetical protein
VALFTAAIDAKVLTALACLLLSHGRSTGEPAYPRCEGTDNCEDGVQGAGEHGEVGCEVHLNLSYHNSSTSNRTLLSVIHNIPLGAGICVSSSLTH